MNWKINAALAFAAFVLAALVVLVPMDHDVSLIPGMALMGVVLVLIGSLVVGGVRLLRAILRPRRRHTHTAR